MASIQFTANSLTEVDEGEAAAISGKNGFIGQAGTVPILVTDASLADLNDNVVLTVSNLHLLYDSNFSNHILEVNDGFYGGLRGLDYVSIPIREKANTGTDLDFVGFNPVLTQFSSNIVSYNISANTITFNNELSNGVDIFSKLPNLPFYAKLPQILDPRFFDSKKVYVTGSKLYRQVSNNVEDMTGEKIFDLKVTPRASSDIRVWQDGVEIFEGTWVWDNQANISLDISNDISVIKTRVDYYTVPAIEMGDNVSFYSENVYSVANVSYDPASPTFNSSLTNACFYEVEFSSNIRANLSGLTFTNISSDIIGQIGNVNTSSNSFTLDYNETTYPGLFNLANNQIYKIQVPLNFNPITLPSDRIIRAVEPGVSLVRARNKNSTGRRSPFVRKEVIINELPIKKVENLTITESLYKDTAQGVAVRVVISFDAILDQEVSDYEISYKLDTETGDLSTFNTVKVPASGIDEDGKIRFAINNIDRGRAASINSITVRIVPLNKTIRGIRAEKTQTIVGKSAPPLNIIALSGGQEGQNVIFNWQVPKNADGTVVDLDLNEIIVRRLGGVVSPSDALEKWPVSDPVTIVATPASSVTLGIGSYGVYTYFFRTRDTSGNESETISTITITTQRPPRLEAYKAWSEDEPSGNVVVGLPNENTTENTYPSFADSTGGLSDATTGPVDNANGSSSGWSVVGGSPTDLLASDDATYTTQIRDVGTEVTGSIIVNANGTQGITSTFNDFREIILDGVTEASPGSNVLVDVDFGGVGHILGFDNATAATVSYNSYIGTLTSGGPSGNVYAIWNPGQFAGDVSNANSWAKIAGVINANAIALGQAYYANGEPNGSNVLANLITSTSYELVNLEQFNDDAGLVTFQGEDGLVSTNLEYRYSTSDPYYANGNVNAAAFVDGAVNEGWKPYSAATVTFRYFQIRFNVTNNNPIQADYLLDELNYALDLENKIFTETIAIAGSPQSVDFSVKNFIDPPSINLTVASDNNYTAVVLPGWTTEGANINVYSNTGTAVTGIDVTVTAIGV